MSEYYEVQTAMSVYDALKRFFATRPAVGEPAVALPLAKRLLGIIASKPGINRRQLHRATHGRIPAVQISAGLAELREHGQARCLNVPTAGRPAECWYPNTTITTKEKV